MTRYFGNVVNRTYHEQVRNDLCARLASAEARAKRWKEAARAFWRSAVQYGADRADAQRARAEKAEAAAGQMRAALEAVIRTYDRCTTEERKVAVQEARNTLNATDAGRAYMPPEQVARERAEARDAALADVEQALTAVHLWSCVAHVISPLRKPSETLRADASERSLTLETKLAASQARVDALLATVAKVSRETPYPDELKGWEAQRGAMLAEVGTLRAKLAEVTERAEAAERDIAYERDGHQMALDAENDIRAKLVETEASLAYEGRLREHTADGMHAYLRRAEKAEDAAAVLRDALVAIARWASPEAEEKHGRRSLQNKTWVDDIERMRAALAFRPDLDLHVELEVLREVAEAARICDVQAVRADSGGLSITFVGWAEKDAALAKLDALKKRKVPDAG